jgi:hypothetical protein
VLDGRIVGLLTLRAVATAQAWLGVVPWKGQRTVTAAT